MEYYDSINSVFNKRLQQQIDGKLPDGFIYCLGLPNGRFLSTGFPDIPIELSASHLEKKSKTKRHTFNLSEIKDLPYFMNKPIAIFSYGDKTKAQNVIVENQSGGKYFVVGIHFYANDSKISSIRGLYPKDNAEWLNWIAQGKTLFLEKEKVQTLISQQQKNLADVAYLDLNLITKIIKEFKNPPIVNRNNDLFDLNQQNNALKGFLSEYKLKPGDHLVKWEMEYTKAILGRVTISRTRTSGVVQELDGDQVTALIDGKTVILSAEKVTKNSYAEEDLGNGRFKAVVFSIIPEGYLVADYDEIDAKFAENSYRNTSMDPDKMGILIRRDWEIAVNDFALFLDKECDTEAKRQKAIDLHKTFHDKTKSLMVDYLSSHSNCISSMIVGPAGFPTARAQKWSDAADKKLAAYYDYVKLAKKKYPKIIEETLTSEEKESGLTYEKKEFIRKLENDLALAKEMANKPKGSVPSWMRTNLNSALLSRLETLWRNRDYELFNMALDKIKASGLIFSKTNAIWERHANTPTSELYQSPEFKRAEELLKICEEKLTQERYEKDKEDLQWTFNHLFGSMEQQKRVRSIKIIMQRLKAVQENRGFELLNPDSYFWKYLKDDDGDEVEAPSAENPEGGKIYEAEECEVVDNMEAQRVQILFPGKPSTEIISHLKSNGFRWSPRFKAWQRQNTPEGRRKALEFAKKFFPKEEKKEDEKKLLLAKAKMKMASAKIKLMDLGLGRITYEMD